MLISQFFKLDMMRQQQNISPIDRKMVPFLPLELCVINLSKQNLTNLSWSACLYNMYSLSSAVPWDILGLRYLA